MEDILLRVVGQIYDTAFTEDGWPNTLEAINRCIGADASALMYHDMPQHGSSAQMLSWAGFSPADMQDYAESYAAHDVRVKPFSKVPVGGIYLDERDIAMVEVEKSLFYNDYMKPRGLKWATGANLFEDKVRWGILGIHRAAGRGQYSDDNIHELSLLIPHLRRALQLHRQVTAAKTLAAGLRLALDHFNTAAFLVDETCLVVEMNAAAEDMLRSNGSPLRICSRRLAAQVPHQTDRLRQAIGAVTGVFRHQQAITPPDIMRLSTTDYSATVSIMVVPVGPHAQFGQLSRPMALVFASSSVSNVLPNDHFVAAIFGLSPTESMLAVHLASGRSLQDFADERRVSIETARTQLRTVFAKTGAHSQGQLIGIVLKSLATLRWNNADRL